MATPAAPAATRLTQTLAYRRVASQFLTPGFADVFFLGILLTAFVLGEAGWGRLLLDGDTGLHTRIGDYIVANRTVPTTDPLSFTQFGDHSAATEWLTAVVFSLLNSAFGLKGVVFVCGIAIAAAFTFLLQTCLVTGANGLVALILVLIAANVSSFHFHARPHAFTWIFLTSALYLLATDKVKQSRRIWLLIPLTVLWVNFHRGYAILFAVLGVILVGTFLQGITARPVFFRYLKLWAACALASLINPFGYKLHFETFRYLRNKTVLSMIEEFQSPVFRTEPQMLFMIMLFAGLGICGFLIARRKYPEVLLILSLVSAALVSVRHVPIYTFVAVPLIAVELSAFWTPWASAQPRQSIARILHDVSGTLGAQVRPLGIWSAVAIAALFTMSTFPRDFSDERFPVAIAARHSAELASARLYTTDQWADYLMFKNPAQKVFIDDRSFFTDTILSDALKIMAAEPGWREAVRKYQINMVLCPAGTALASALAEDSRWKLIDKDAQRRLFRLEAN